MAALVLLSAMAIYLGKFISSIADKKVITKVAGIVFVLMGMTFFLF
jgi:putative Ca2+/H+ antiporter (TMEM165/GDT1 family)